MSGQHHHTRIVAQITVCSHDVQIMCTHAQWEKKAAHLLFLELVDKVSQKSIVKVLATKERVTIGGLDLKDASAHLQDGDIKCSTA